MDFLIIISIQLLLMIIGFLVTILVGVKDKLEALGLSYLFGSGLITILFLINHFIFNIDLNGINFLLAIIVSLVLLTFAIVLSKKRISLIKIKKLKNGFNNVSCFEKFIIVFLLLILGYTFLENYIWPITDWDALALYDFRARVMSTTGNMSEGVELGYFFQYPPFTSFLHVFGYIFGSERVKIVYSFIYFSLLMTFYSLLKKTQANYVALLGVLMLGIDAFVFRHATMAYTNLSYVAFISLGLIYLTFWLNNSSKKDLLVGGILVGLSTWVRASDPFWYIGILIILFGLIKKKKQIRVGASLILGTVLIYKFWDYFVATINISSNTQNRESLYLKVLTGDIQYYLNIIKSIPMIIIYFWDNVIIIIKHLLPLTIFTIYYDFKNKNNLNIISYILLIISWIMIFAGIIVFSLFYETWDLIGESLQRMSMVLIPLVIFIIYNSSIWKENVFKNK